MHERQFTSRALSLTVGLATLAAAGRASAQSGAKVLTPPKPADTAARQPVATRSTTANTPGTPAPSAARPPITVPQTPVLDSIRGVVFHSLLDRDRSGFATLASAFCLALSNDDYKKASPSADRVDASESLVRRVASPRTPTRRASTCTFSANTPGRPVMGRALLYTVGAIDLSDDRAEAAASYNYDGYSAGGFTFSVERSDSGWVVKQWRQEWTGKPNAP
jgi:hypothetical protein